MYRAASSTACFLVALTCASFVGAKGPSSARYADNTSGIFWFLHISDSHIAEDNSNSGTNSGDPFDKFPKIRSNLEFAIGEARSVIGPKFIVHTGDIVDHGSLPAQWSIYKSVTSAAGMKLPNFIDLPGNHDGIDDPGFPHYRNNSVLGTTTGHISYEWSVTTQLDGAEAKYYFLGLDSAGYATMDGSGHPVPEFPDTQIAVLPKKLNEHATDELIFVFAHHPLTDSTPLPANANQVVGHLENANAFYVHGHRHRFGESLSDGKIVTAEVADLAHAAHQNLGVGVVDHNAFIYRATSVATPWPLVIITAPVNRHLDSGSSATGPVNPYAYSVCKNRTNNPVRALVFSKSSPSQVQVAIAGMPAVSMTSFGSPPNLWGTQVNTSSLTAGAHDVVVTATAGGKSAEHRISAQFDDCPTVQDAGPEDADSATETSVGGAAGADGGAHDGLGATAGKSGGPQGDARDAESSDSDQVDSVPGDGGCACWTSRRPSRSWFIALGIATVGLARRRPRGSGGKMLPARCSATDGLAAGHERTPSGATRPTGRNHEAQLRL